MKKIGVLIIFCFLSLSLFAQQKFENSFEFVQQIGRTDHYKSYYGIEMINGFRNDLLSYGVGFGVGRGTYGSELINHKFDDESFEMRYKTTTLVPLYGRIRIDFMRGAFSPFLLGNAGYVFDVGKKGQTEANGIYGEAGFGAETRIKASCKLYFLIGVSTRNSQFYTTDDLNKGLIIDKKNILYSFRVGFMF